MKTYRILSIDGGGIKGIISARLLCNIEKMLQEKYGNNIHIADYFDLVAGTSTGGIIVSLLLLKDKDNNYVYNTQDIFNFYVNYGSDIFSKSMLYKIKTIFGLFGSKYDNTKIKNLLNQYLKDYKLSDLSKPTIICAYNIDKNTCHLFKQHNAITNKSSDFLLKDVVLSTSAAPTYFPPTNIKSLSDEKYILVDGGIYANNPSMCAYIELNKIFPNTKTSDIKVLSIGTGYYKHSYKYSNVYKWGIIKWLAPFIDMVLKSTNEITDYQFNLLYNSYKCTENYIRINMQLNYEQSKIDNIKDSNINDLIKKGDEAFELYRNELEMFF